MVWPHLKSSLSVFLSVYPFVHSCIYPSECRFSLPLVFLRHLYETLLPENLGRHCREWPAGKADSEIRQLIQENSKPQDLIVYTGGSVTKKQSGWGFTVKQGATTIHESRAAYEVWHVFKVQQPPPKNPVGVLSWTCQK